MTPFVARLLQGYMDRTVPGPPPPVRGTPNRTVSYGSTCRVATEATRGHGPKGATALACGLTTAGSELVPAGEAGGAELVWCRAPPTGPSEHKPSESCQGTN